MKLRKVDHVTNLFTALLCLLIIILNYNTYIEKANLDLASKNVILKVQILSSKSVLFLILGIVLISLGTFIHMQLNKYRIGQLFSVYLFLVGNSLALSPLQSLGDNISWFIKSLAIISIPILLYTIGQLTLMQNDRVFRFCGGIQLIVTLISLCIYTLWFSKVIILSVILTSNLLAINIVIFTLMSLFLMKTCYKRSNSYTKKQIVKLSLALMLGTFLFIIVYFLPIVAVIKVPTNEIVYITKDSFFIGPNDNLSSLLERDTLYLLIFSVIPIVIINVLIKREYINLSYNQYLVKIIFYDLFVTLLNVFIFVFTSWKLGILAIFNFILLLPMIERYICYIKSNHAGDELSNTIKDVALLNVLEEERENISIYLHDQVLQSLIAIQHLNEDIQNKEKINLQLSNIISETRNLSHDLYPIMVEDLGLEQSIRAFFDDLSNDYNIEFEFLYLFPNGTLPKLIALSVYRIVKELVNNSIKHSSCSTILVTIGAEDMSMVLSVIDDGIGFSMSDKKVFQRSPHMGLFSIEKQVERLNGSMRFISGPGSGAKFVITIPLNSNSR